MKILFIGLLSALYISCANGQSDNPDNSRSQEITIPDEPFDPAAVDTATFAGGCFWCMEGAFQQIKGIKAVISGYSGGNEPNPGYRQVGSGETGHAESIQIYYDPKEISYKTLLDIFFVAHDPTQLNRQGPDVGPQYRSAVFYHNEKQKKAAEEKILELQGAVFAKKIVTEVSPYQGFWPAESYHQNYEMLHPNNPYIQEVSRPRIEKVRKSFPKLLKDEKK